MWHWLLLVGAPTDPNGTWGAPPLVWIGAGLSLPSTASWLLWKDRGRQQQKSDQQLADLQLKYDNREKELSDRVIPLLTRAVDVLSEAPARFDAALQQASESTRRSEIELMMDKLGRAVNHLENRD